MKDGERLVGAGGDISSVSLANTEKGHFLVGRKEETKEGREEGIGDGAPFRIQSHYENNKSTHPSSNSCCDIEKEK